MAAAARGPIIQIMLIDCILIPSSHNLTQGSDIAAMSLPLHCCHLVTDDDDVAVVDLPVHGHLYLTVLEWCEHPRLPG